MEDALKKLSYFQRYFLKYTNRSKYNAYKLQVRLHNEQQYYLNAFQKDFHSLQTNLTKVPAVAFKHAGHAGDLIYSLPVVRALAKDKGINFYLELGKPGYAKSENHPAGRARFNEKSYQMLAPLLKCQPNFDKVDIYNNELVNVDLDVVRQLPVTQTHHIPRWYFMAFNVYYDLTQPWLMVDCHSSIKSKIVIARSFRHRNSSIDYSFLQKYSDLLFLGVEEEYQDLKRQVPNLEFYQVKDFLEMAQIIYSSRLFIGNQSLPFALAEALKVKRILEVYPYLPNVVPEGTNGFDFYFQSHFENLVQNLVELEKY